MMTPTDSTPQEGGASAPAEVSTHVLVPQTWVQALRDFSRSTRITQSVYLRDVVVYVLETYAENAPVTSLPPASGPFEGALVSVVFRVAPSKLEDLRALSKRTRVRQSEYLREGIWALPTKHGVAPEARLPGPT